MGDILYDLYCTGPGPKTQLHVEPGPIGATAVEPSAGPGLTD